VESPCEKILFLIQEKIPFPKDLQIKFSIYMVLASMTKTEIKKRIWVDNLDFLSESYRFWLLSKYKNILFNIKNDPRMEQFSKFKTIFLELFCKQNNIKFNNLKIDSSLPPSRVFKNQKYRRYAKKLDINKKSLAKTHAHPLKTSNARSSSSNKRYRSNSKSGVNCQNQNSNISSKNLEEKNDYAFSNQDDESHYTPSKIIKSNNKLKNRIKSSFDNAQVNDQLASLDNSKKSKNLTGSKNEINLTIDDEPVSDNQEIDIEMEYNKGKTKTSQILKKRKFEIKEEIISLPNLNESIKNDPPPEINSNMAKENVQKTKDLLNFKKVSEAVKELIGDLKHYKQQLSSTSGISFIYFINGKLHPMR
jgi:hypothetical protein